MFYSKFFKFLFCFSIISTIFTSEKLPSSFPKIFPEEDLQRVTLPYPYHSMTKEEKSSILIQEGNYTILEEDSSVLVGPLRPCQLIVFIFKNGPTMVAHATYNSNFTELLNNIKKQYSHYNFSEIIAELFTVDYDDYTSSIHTVDRKSYSFKDFYEGRSQEEELNFKKKIIKESFNIQNDTQIQLKKFIPDRTCYTALKFFFAPMYVFIKRSSGKTICYNTCPLTENYWGDVTSLSIKEFDQKIKEISLERIYSNLFIQKVIADLKKNIAYNSVPFVYIKNNKDS